METKNTYGRPIDGKNIRKIVTKESPAHIVYHSRKFGTEIDLRHAVDFICEEGTPVKAAFYGEVVALVDIVKENYSGWEIPAEKDLPEEKQEGNFVLLKHDNEEFSTYCHLGHKKVLVKKGQSVKTDEVIGYTGNTGWSIVPHLHFAVFKFTKPMPARDIQSLEIRWKK